VFEADKDMTRFYDTEMWTDDWFGTMGSRSSQNYAVETGWVSEIR
jgi:hypothetical protein